MNIVAIRFYLYRLHLQLFTRFVLHIKVIIKTKTQGKSITLEGYQLKQIHVVHVETKTNLINRSPRPVWIVTGFIYSRRTLLVVVYVGNGVGQGGFLIYQGREGLYETDWLGTEYQTRFFYFSFALFSFFRDIHVHLKKNDLKLSKYSCDYYWLRKMFYLARESRLHRWNLWLQWTI